jgi:hypothetical protein
MTDQTTRDAHAREIGRLNAAHAGEIERIHAGYDKHLEYQYRRGCGYDPDSPNFWTAPLLGGEGWHFRP